MVCVTKVAKSALDKALDENPDLYVSASPQLTAIAEPTLNPEQALILKIDPGRDIIEP